jgi:hypothetical protein
MNQEPNPFAHNNVVEKLVDNLAEALGTNSSDEKKKPQEPSSLIERNAELKELKARRKAKKSQMKSEIEAVADDLGIKTKSAAKAAKKAKVKARTSSFSAALKDLAKTKAEVRSRLQKAQINGNEKEESQAKRDLELVKIQERIYASVSVEERSKKGSLDRVIKASETIQKQMNIIETAQEPAQRKRFFGFFSKTDTRTTESRQRAITESRNIISEAREEAGLSADKTLTQMINSYIS